MASASEELPILAPGTVLGKTYTVQSLLGTGAYGAVYRVVHRFLGVQALKLLRVWDIEDARTILQEGQILAGLSHRHVVRVFDANIFDLPSGQFPYLTMEFVSGGTLANLLKQRMRLEVKDALIVAAQVLDGLAAIHMLNPPVLHRDLTPDNILIASTEPLTIKIGDFGLATPVNPTTGLAHAVGVIRYLAPESNWGYATVAGDLYATAFILYELLTGTAAYPLPRFVQQVSIADLQEAMLAPRRTPAAPPSRFRPELGPAIDGLIVRALSPDPRHRFGDAAVFGDSVRAVLSTT